MAKYLDTEGTILKEIVDGMHPNRGRWIMAVENPSTSPPTVEVYLGDKDQEFRQFRQETSHIPDEWQPVDVAFLLQVTRIPSVIELTEDLLAFAPEEIRPDILERRQRRRVLENIIQSMASKQGIKLRRTMPPIELV